MTTPTPITIAYGDGIGPEIMTATMAILQEGGAQLTPQEISVGESVYLNGVSTGIEESAWESLRSTKVFLKAPITTPQGKGMKSLNVTIRKTLGLYANIRPCISYHPFVKTNFPNMDVLIVRENEEDLYAGIEHRQTQQVTQALKLISTPGSEKIIRYAFEYAKTYGRKKVTAVTKDNIMKICDGKFHQIFDDVAKEYPDIETDHFIVDIGMAKMAVDPYLFDVVVLPNLYGDILSDVAAEITGSVGICGSANIGENFAMFEAIHGSAPDIAGQGIANPSGLLLGAIQMLAYIDQGEAAERIHNAWLSTLEDGVHTGDIYNEATSQKRVSTEDFTKEVISRLGKTPNTLPIASYPSKGNIQGTYTFTQKENKALVGVDIFLDNDTKSANELGTILKQASSETLQIVVITNRGVKVWPDGFDETFCSDHWRCRFESPNGNSSHSEIIALLQKLNDAGLDVIKTENLYTFNGNKGYSLAAGQ